MRKYLIRSILFFLILSAIVFGSELLVPYYWGAPQLVGKMTYYKQHKNDFNTLFLGTSQVYRQIIPSLFDTLTEGETRSFNFGIPGMSSLEMYAFYENLLKKDISPQIKYVFMQLLPVQSIPDQYLHSERAKYFLNYHYYTFAVNYFKTGLHIYDDKHREKIIGNYTIAYREKIFKIALLKKMLMFIFSPPKYDKKMLGKQSDGFYSLEEESLLRISECVKCRQTSENINNNLKAVNTAYQNVALLKANKVYIQELNRLIEESKKRNIHLIFYLPPLEVVGGHNHMMPIFHQINEKNKIYLANPIESPELYAVDIYFDTAHYNDKGAKICTAILAKKFNELLKKNIQ